MLVNKTQFCAAIVNDQAVDFHVDFHKTSPFAYGEISFWVMTYEPGSVEALGNLAFAASYWPMGYIGALESMPFVEWEEVPDTGNRALLMQHLEKEGIEFDPLDMGQARLMLRLPSLNKTDNILHFADSCVILIE